MKNRRAATRGWPLTTSPPYQSVKSGCPFEVESPPSTGRITPLTKPASAGLARKAMTLATSVGFGDPASGMRWRSAVPWPRGAWRARRPAAYWRRATALTRMPFAKVQRQPLRHQRHRPFEAL